MRKTTRAVLTIFALTVLILSFTSCNIIRKVITNVVSDVASDTATNEKNTDLTDEVKSSDGKLSIMVPSSWNKKDSSLNETAVISVSNRLLEQYVIVINESKVDFQDGFTVKEYFDLIKQGMSTSITDSVWSNEEETTVGLAKAYSAQVSGTVQKIKVVYWVYIIDTGDSFSQVLGWTLNSKVDANKELIYSIINSFNKY